jgi:ubiquinone biosynthesis protein COQ9
MLIDDQKNKQIIIENLLKIVAFEGWSNDSLKSAFIKTNLNENFLELIFEDKIFSAIEFITDDYCQQTKNFVVDDQDFNQQKINQKIAKLLFVFLTIDIKNKSAHQRLLNFYLNPKNLINQDLSMGLRPSYFALNQAYLVADFMWKLIGDNSTDINFYSKRIILSKIIIRSLLYYVNNDDLNLLKKYIDKQISNVLKFTKIKNDFKKNFDIFKNKIDESLNDIQSPNFEPLNIIKKLPFFRLFNKNIFK